MTPLAHQIFKNSFRAAPDRQRFVDPYGVAPKLRIAHCFEVSDVFDLARTLLAVGKDDGPAIRLEGITIPTAGKVGVQRLKDMAGRYCFLPAPVTWIEWKLRDSAMPRTGLLLDQMFSDELISVVAVCNDEAQLAFSFDPKGDLEKTAIHHQEHEGLNVSKKEQVAVGIYLGITVSLLAIINTPKIFAREQHEPHAGLQRTLARSMGSVGKYPMAEWTEIKLRIIPPAMGDGDGSHEGHLTGAKALHFCRSHLRLRLGRVELVTAHWRGDPSLGIRSSRYKVVK